MKDKTRKILTKVPVKIIYFSHIEKLCYESPNIVLIEESVINKKEILGDYGILRFPRLKREIKIPL